MARLVVAALIVTAAFYVNFRFVLVNFSDGGDLFDTGWFAWIMASGDPWLISPRAVSGLSFFNYHLAPYLSVLSIAFHAFGIDSFTALALHQGAMFALLTGSLCATALSNWSGWRSATLFVAAALFMLVGDIVLQIASFPHFEIAIPAFCALGAALWQGGRRRWAVIAFAVACLVREDGGLYAGAFLLGLAALQPWTRKLLASPEAMVAAAAIVVSLLMFWIKARFFPGFATFALNYSGNNWDHVTAGFVWGRVRDLAANPHALTALLTALLLAAVSVRYLVFPVLLLPLIVAQLLSVRDNLGHFAAYYAMPFLVIWVGLVVVAGDRAKAGKLRTIEPALLLFVALLGSGPALFLLQPPAWFPVAATALVTPVIDLPQLARDATAAIGDDPQICISNGVAALIPDHFAPGRLVIPASDLSACRTIFLFNHDLHYEALKPRVAGWTAGPVIGGRIERYDRQP